MSRKLFVSPVTGKLTEEDFEKIRKLTNGKYYRVCPSPHNFGYIGYFDPDFTGKIARLARNYLKGYADLDGCKLRVEGDDESESVLCVREEEGVTLASRKDYATWLDEFATKEELQLMRDLNAMKDFPPETLWG